MKRFLDTNLINLLSSFLNSRKDVNVIELSDAYDDFVSQLLDFCRKEQDVILLCFTVNYTIAELKELSMKLGEESDSENIYIKFLLMKILDILDSTYQIVKFRIDNPDLFQGNKDGNLKSDVYLAQDVDLIDIMEIICGLYYSHSVKNKIGNQVNFTELTRIFENGFNFKFADIYKKRDDVFKRKAIKITEFLNELIIAIKIESKNRGYL